MHIYAKKKIQYCDKVKLTSTNEKLGRNCSQKTKLIHEISRQCKCMPTANFNPWQPDLKYQNLSEPKIAWHHFLTTPTHTPCENSFIAARQTNLLSSSMLFVCDRFNDTVIPSSARPTNKKRLWLVKLHHKFPSGTCTSRIC